MTRGLAVQGGIDSSHRRLGRGDVGHGMGSTATVADRTDALDPGFKDLAAGLKEARWLTGLCRPRRLPVKPRSPGKSGSTPDTSATREAEKGDTEDEVAGVGSCVVSPSAAQPMTRSSRSASSLGVTTHIPIGP